MSDLVGPVVVVVSAAMLAGVVLASVFGVFAIIVAFMNWREGR